MRIPIIDDEVKDEPDERFWVVVSNLKGATTTPGETRGEVVIVDNDITPLTAQWVNPGELFAINHTVPRTITLQFNKDVGDADTNDLKSAIEVTAGTVTAVAKTDNRNFLVTVTGTSGAEHIRLKLPAETEVTEDETLSADAAYTWWRTTYAQVRNREVEVAEGETASVTIYVTPEAASAITVTYRTADGTATAPADYTAVSSGTVTIAAGEREATVEIETVSDAVDEGDETFTVELTGLSGGAPARLLPPNPSTTAAEVTITNDGPVPRAWLARFGRTVAEQVIEAAESRMGAPRTPGAEASLAGRRIGPDPVGLAAWLRGATEDAQEPDGPGSRTTTERELLPGSSFALTAGVEGGPGGTVSLWGRGAVTEFDGRDGALSLDGEVATGMLGTDWNRGRLTAGLILGHSRGDGGYRAPTGGGTVASSLTGVYPWGRYAVSERVSVWGLAGYGAGTLTLTPDGRSAMRADPRAHAGSGGGARGVLVEAPADGGPQLAVKSDAMAVRTASEKTRGMAASRAEVTRLRLGLEGSWQGLAVGNGGRLEPEIEIGVRHDGGDAETGFGLDAGGRALLVGPVERSLGGASRARSADP